ncbi:hypothetical protein MBLNU459_g6188t1 [Dothideomycetes sp. NU459]
MADSEPSYLHTKVYIPVPIVFLVISTIAVSLRIWVKVRLLKALGADDWLLMLAQLIFAGTCTCFIVIIEEESGRSPDKIPVITLNLVTMIGIGLYCLGQIAFKLSLTVFFLRIVKERWQIWLIRTAIVIYVVYIMTSLLLLVFRCGSPGPLIYLSGAMNAAMDWIFALTPMFVIARMRMSRRDKVSVCCLITLAIFGSIVSIIRVPYIGTLKFGPDFFERDYPCYIWSIVESGLGTIAISLASLRPLVRLIRDELGYNDVDSDQMLEAQNREPSRPNDTPVMESVIMEKSTNDWRGATDVRSVTVITAQLPSEV